MSIIPSNSHTQQRETSNYPIAPRLVRGLSAAFLTLIVGILSASAQPQPGGTIRYGHEQEPACLYGSWIHQAYIQRQYSDNIVSRTDDGKIVPWLATSWSLSTDNKTYIFQIKPGVKFTDGTVLDAEAIAYNFNRWLDPDPDKANRTARLYLLDYLDSAKATGPLSLEIKLKRPYQPFLSVLTHAFFGIMSPASLEKGPKISCEQPVGSGPFIVEKWNRGQNIIFKRNPDYNSAPANARHQGPAYVDGIVWKFLRDPTVRYGSLLGGDSDVIYDVPGVDWADANKKFKVIRHITAGTPLRLQLNTAYAPFDDIRVRKAFAYSTDRKRAVETSFLGSVPYNGNGALSQSSPEYTKEFDNFYPFDKAKANRLLDEAGWTERNDAGTRLKAGKPLSVRIVYGAGSLITPDGTQALQVIQNQAKAVGFDVVLVPITQAEYFAGKNRGPTDYEAQPAYWVASSAEIFQINWRPDEKGVPNSNNASKYQPPDLWAIIQEADSTFDDARRTQLYQKAERHIVESAAVLGLYPLTLSLASKPNVKDVWISTAISEPVFHDAYFEK